MPLGLLNGAACGPFYGLPFRYDFSVHGGPLLLTNLMRGRCPALDVGRGARKIHPFPRDENVVEYQRRRKRSVRNYGITIVAIGAAFALFYFVFGGR